MPDGPLTYTLVDGSKPGTKILKLEGPLTLATMFPLQKELRTLTPLVLIVDLSGVPYMDSAGVGLLPNYQVSAQRNGRKLFLAGVNDRLRALLELTHLITVLKPYPTVADCEAEL